LLHLVLLGRQWLAFYCLLPPYGFLILLLLLLLLLLLVMPAVCALACWHVCCIAADGFVIYRIEASIAGGADVPQSIRARELNGSRCLTVALVAPERPQIGVCLPAARRVGLGC
jgi:hypothetical protein